MASRGILTLATGCWLIAAALVSAQQTMKVELSRWDFEWYKGSTLQDRTGPNPGENFGWGIPTYPGDAYAGERCFRGAGVNVGFGAVVVADPITQLNTLYQAEWMVKNTGPLPGRAQFELGGIASSGYTERNYWTKDTWVKDSISWRTPASFDLNANALILWIASRNNEGNPAGLTSGFYIYLDDIAVYKIVPKAPAPPVVGFFSRAADGQPRDTSVSAGQIAMFTVQAYGLAPMTYQWKKGGQPIAGATSRTLRVINTGAADNGRYSCTVTNADGNATSNEATLTVSGTSGIVRRQTGADMSAARVTLNGSTATLTLAIAGAWTMELRTLDGRLVRKTAGAGTQASIAMPVGTVTYIARVRAGGQTCTTKIVCGK